MTTATAMTMVVAVAEDTDVAEGKLINETRGASVSEEGR